MTRLLPIALLIFASHAAPAATLRAAGRLDAPVVKLSDLFDGVAPGADRVLGPAPAPGGRVVVEAPQLGAIARQFGLDWAPRTRAEQIVLERPGRPMDRAAAIAAILQALRAADAPSDCPAVCDIELAGFSPPMLPADGEAKPAASQLEYDAGSGRFTTLLSVAAPGMDAINMRVVGRVYETVELPVAARPLLAGTVIADSDLRPARVRAATLRAEVARLPAQAVGLALRHAVSTGQPLPLVDLGRPVVVPKGALVQMQLESPGLTLSASGQAVDPGAAGDTIRVLNPISRMTVLAQVTAPGRVRVAPGAAPLIEPARAALAAAR